eukprot:TRINITY_DN13028_c0_g1_i1.p1 TRINITY_DN13028_c0_g1~~TRINITY_DN13028_c0_g1_i1.p1  ORF type:complete len:598 (+),score=172.54 TRINITY_DN13028_c0_g1_i1:28-1821(+)
MLNLIESQAKEIRKILNLEWVKSKEAGDECIWKMLIFDNTAKDILATLFRVGNLREDNITLHLTLNSTREKVHTVKAIYLVAPTEENLKKIVEDFARDLYDNVYINFLAPVPNDAFQRFAKSLAKFNCLYKIRDVSQHALAFMSLAHDAFTLNIPKAFKHLSSPKEDKTEAIAAIAHGLFSVCRTMRILPVVHYPDGAVAADVIRALDAVVKDYKASTEFEEERDEFDAHAGDLIIVEREEDLASVLLHPWNYAALTHDVLEIKNNRIDLTVEGKKTEYDLDARGDAFWRENLHKPFPYAAEEIDKELNAWKTAYENMSHRKVGEDAREVSENLERALDQVPEMTERKKKLDMHTNIATFLFGEVRDRSLDKLFELETALLFNKKLTSQERTQMLELFSARKPHKESALDKLRLLYIYVQTAENIRKEDIAKCLEVLKSSGTTIAERILEFFSRNRNLEVPKAEESKDGKETGTSRSLHMLKGLAASVKTHGKGLLQNVQNILPGADQLLVVSKIVESLLENRRNAFSEGYKILDLSIAGRTKSAENVIVFHLDGGSYVEYHNLQDLSRKMNKKFLYGCSQILSAKELLSQLAEISS